MSNKMPEIELRKEIRRFLEKRKVLVLCTCSNNVPRATPMDFYIEKNTDNFLIGTYKMRFKIYFEQM